MPQREYIVYKINKDKVDRLRRKRTSDLAMFSYFILSNLSLQAYFILKKYNLFKHKWAKWLVGLTVVHYALVFIPMWCSIVRHRSLYEQTITQLTLLSCGKKFTVTNLFNEKSTYLISDDLFLTKERALEIKEAS